ncbi:MAG: hypothetical protein ABIT58_00250, partial [Ferruginibacter sp.]
MTDINAKRIFGVLFFLAGFTMNILGQAVQPVNHEKIYIHYDKPFYSAGETIWFKAYLYNNGLPSLLSDELYLQVEDAEGKLISKKKYPVQGATVTGSIVLSDTLARGYYMIDAITKTIASGAAEFKYAKNLFIYHPLEPARKESIAKRISLQFFPEGGHLIDRIRTQVAFKATDETGNPFLVSGVIKLDSTNVVTQFKSSHDGIGKISFTPHLADILFAEVDVNGTKYKFPLPAVEASGVYLKIADADSGNTFEITRSRKDRELFDTVRLVVKMNDDTVFEKIIPFGNELVLAGFLKTKNLSSGILHFMLLNKYAVPLAERLSFTLNKEDLIKPGLVFIKRDSSKKAANSFELKFADTTTRSFSVSVTDITTKEFPDKENIWSRLLLTSDLRGYIYNPGYYFESDDAEHRQALDNLMLTHGWTRYNVRQNTASDKTNNDHYLITISGSVTEAGNGKSVAGGTLELQLITEDSSFQSYDAIVDKNGKFKLDSLLFFGTSKIFYNYISINNNRQSVNLHFDEDAGDSLYTILSNSMNKNKSMERIPGVKKEMAAMPNQLSDGKYKQLATIFLKTKLRKPEERINDKYASPLFRNSGKIILDNINKPYNNKTLNVVNYVLTNIHTLAYDADYNSLVNRKNFSILTSKNWIVDIMIDESTSSLEVANGITMDRVALIKFYETGFVGAGTQSP